LETARPLPIPLAKLAVGVAVRVPGAVLLPQQQERDAGPLQFLMQRGPVRHDAVCGRCRPAKQARFQHTVVHIVSERPDQTSGRGALQVGGDRAEPDPARLRNGTLREPGEFQSKNVAKFSHR
jgi:hypothetical protein